MNLDGYQDVFFIITYGLAIVMLSSLAAWKNRNPLAWGLIGGLVFLTSFICLLLESHLCPKCKAPLTKDEREAKELPNLWHLVEESQAWPLIDSNA